MLPGLLRYPGIKHVITNCNLVTYMHRDCVHILDGTLHILADFFFDKHFDPPCTHSGTQTY